MTSAETLQLIQNAKKELLRLMRLSIPATPEDWDLLDDRLEVIRRRANTLARVVEEEKEIQKLLEDEAKVKAIQEKIEQEDELKEKLIHDIETEEEYDRNDEGAY